MQWTWWPEAGTIIVTGPYYVTSTFDLTHDLGLVFASWNVYVYVYDFGLSRLNFESPYLRNRMADWHGSKGMWVNHSWPRLLSDYGNLRCWHAIDIPSYLKYKLCWSIKISRMRMMWFFRCEAGHEIPAIGHRCPCLPPSVPTTQPPRLWSLCELKISSVVNGGFYIFTLSSLKKCGIFMETILTYPWEKSCHIILSCFAAMIFYS